MKPAGFDYTRPETVEETLTQLAEYGDEAKLLAGGQSLVPMLNMRLARPAVIVDVNRIAGLDEITEVNGSVRVGALARQATFGSSPLVASRVSLAAESVPYIGHFVTRNRGTVGGSIAHADAKAELPLALLALAGSVVAASTKERRVVPAEELFVTHYTTSLQPDELLLETIWPAAAPGAGSAFEEFALRTGDYALAMATCSLRIENNRVAEARVAVAGPTDRPILTGVGSLIESEVVTDDLARAAGEQGRTEVDPVDGLHASAAYQRHLVGLLVERAVTRAWRNASEGEN